MKANELTKNTRVLVTKGLWMGFTGIIEDSHPEASVVRLRSDTGEVAYALKTEISPARDAKTT